MGKQVERKLLQFGERYAENVEIVMETHHISLTHKALSVSGHAVTDVPAASPRDRDEVHFLLICSTGKCHFSVWMCGGDVSFNVVLKKPLIGVKVLTPRTDHLWRGRLVLDPAPSVID